MLRRIATQIGEITSDRDAHIDGAGPVMGSLFWRPETAAAPRPGEVSELSANAHPPGEERCAGAHAALLERIVRCLPRLSEAVALSVGCSDAELLARLLGRGAAVSGLDASIGLLKRVTAGHGAAIECGRLELRAGHPRSLPWAPGSFSVVVTTDPSFALSDPLLVLPEYHRVLRPGGRLAIGTSYASALHGIEPPLSMVTDRGQLLAHSPELIRLVQRAGFDLAHLEQDAGYRLVFAVRRSDGPFVTVR